MSKVWDGIPLGRAVSIICLVNGHPYISHHKSRIKISPYDELNNCLTIWFKQMIAKHVHISGDIL